jgi:hypothetical protein
MNYLAFKVYLIKCLSVSGDISVYIYIYIYIYNIYIYIYILYIYIYILGCTNELKLIRYIYYIVLLGYCRLAVESS